MTASSTHEGVTRSRSEMRISPVASVHEPHRLVWVDDHRMEVGETPPR